MRTTREGGPPSLGWSSGDHDDTLDKFTSVNAYHMADNTITFRMEQHDSRGRLINSYDFVADDETFLLDLATMATAGVAAIHSREDMNERMERHRALEPSALDSEEDIARKERERREGPRRVRKQGRRG